jgi:hypothetical protein
MNAFGVVNQTYLPTVGFGRVSRGAILLDPRSVSVARGVVAAQTVCRLAGGVCRRRTALGKAAVTRVRVRVVAAGIGGQPQEGAGGCVRTVESGAGHARA